MIMNQYFFAIRIKCEQLPVLGITAFTWFLICTRKVIVVDPNGWVFGLDIDFDVYV